jgi:predicted nucleotide-binding protein
MIAGIERLKKRREEVERFDPQSVTDQHNTPALDALEAAIDEALVRTFGADTLDYERYKYAKEFNRGPYNYRYQVPAQKFQASITRSKDSSVALLGQAIESLEEQLGERTSGVTEDQELEAPSTPPLSRRVFVVHGHDATPRAEVARFIEKLGFEAIILHERPNKGRTLITKFREEAEGVGFAVVLMTPDDLGKAASAANLNPRARQNVVFELGFFIGALGPERVAALVKGDVERPSDFDGVVYISLDMGSWKTGPRKGAGSCWVRDRLEQGDEGMSQQLSPSSVHTPKA